MQQRALMPHSCRAARTLPRAAATRTASGAAAAAAAAAPRPPQSRCAPPHACSCVRSAPGHWRRRSVVAAAGKPGASSGEGAPQGGGKASPKAARQEGAGEEEEEEGEWDEVEEWGEGDWDEDEGEWEEGEEEGEEEEEEQQEEEAAGRRIPADAVSVPYAEGEFVEVGLITKAFGIRGEVKVNPSTDQPRRRFAKGKRLWLQPPTPRGGPPRGAPPPLLRRVTIEGARVIKPELKGRPGSEIWGLKLSEVLDRNAAEALAGQTLLLAVCDRERLRSADEFYIQDLVGLKVFDHGTGALLGLVTEVCEGTGTFSTLRVRLAPSRADVAESVMRTTLLPFAAEMVPVVDVAAGRMEVDPPPGLFDLVSKRKLRKPYTPEQAARLLAQIEEEEARLGSSGGGGGGGGSGEQGAKPQ